MASDGLFLGIDYGTFKSAMAWFNPDSDQPEILHNAEGGETTRSIVYYGDDETLVGDQAEPMLADDETCDRVTDPGTKRDMGKSRTYFFGARRKTPVDIAADVIAKLKRDAERQHFKKVVKRAVITIPATFNQLEQEHLTAAGVQAGFEEVHVLHEPEAAALAFLATGRTMGRHVLVYDLGAGTFDLAVLTHDAASSTFECVEAPVGLRNGGDDFDQAVYDFVELKAGAQGRALARNGTRNLEVLRHCRERKENLSVRAKVTFSSLLPDGRPFKYDLDRATFETLIADVVNATVDQTVDLLTRSRGRGLEIDTVVLIGGSSRVPLVATTLRHKLPVEPQDWQQRDLAVALGAASKAEMLWGTSRRRKSYRVAVTRAWSGNRLSIGAVAQLQQEAARLSLPETVAVAVETAVMGATKEQIDQRQVKEALGHYRQALDALQARGNPLRESDLARLTVLAKQLGLQPAQATRVEHDAWGGTTAEQVLERQREAIQARGREYLEKAARFQEKKDLDNALYWIEAAADLDHSWPEPLGQKCLIHFEKKNWELAEAAATACLRIAPTSESMRRRRAMCRLHLNQWAEARKDFDEAIKRGAKTRLSLPWRAVAHFRLDATAAAVADLSAAVALADDDKGNPAPAAAIHYVLGTLHQKSDQLPNALKSYVQALNALVVDPATRILMASSDLVSFVEWFEIDLKDKSILKMRSVLWNTAQLVYSGGNRKAVLASFGRTGVPMPADFAPAQVEPATFSLNMASVAAEKNRPGEAKAWLENLIARFPEFDVCAAQRDPHIARVPALAALLAPAGTCVKNLNPLQNQVVVTNKSPFRLTNVQAVVQGTRIEGAPPNQKLVPFQKALSAPKIEKGLAITWDKVFDQPGFVGQNIKSLKITVTSAQGPVATISSGS